MLHTENRHEDRKVMTYGNILRGMLHRIIEEKQGPTSATALAFVAISSLVAEFDLFDKAVAHPDYVETKLNT